MKLNEQKVFEIPVECIGIWYVMMIVFNFTDSAIYKITDEKYSRVLI